MRNLSLARRIARLEVQCARPVHRERLMMLVDFGGADSKPNENVVLDVFRNSGSICWARERVAADPNDTGHQCDPGKHLPDILREIHETCPWRKDSGVCRLCQGTPIATPIKITSIEPQETT